MLPETLYLLDTQAPLVRAWTQVFAPFDGVVPRRADFFSQEADAMVSPANSFGIMDGGLDLAIRDRLGLPLEAAVQARILESHHGELPVGQAEIVPTRDRAWPFLVCAPTMRIPMGVAQTHNSYLALRATLLAIAAFNTSNPATRIRTVVCPGLGTGVGGMSPTRCAVQMRLAYEVVSKPAQIPSVAKIHEFHRKLVSS